MLRAAASKQWFKITPVRPGSVRRSVSLLHKPQVKRAGHAESRRRLPWSPPPHGSQQNRSSDDTSDGRDVVKEETVDDAGFPRESRGTVSTLAAATNRLFALRPENPTRRDDEAKNTLNSSRGSQRSDTFVKGSP